MIDSHRRAPNCCPVVMREREAGVRAKGIVRGKALRELNLAVKITTKLK